jgi:hypothetical protein
MNGNAKALVFWIVVLIAAVGFYYLSNAKQSESASVSIGGEWLMGGDAKQPCAINRQGDVLILVNERGDLATGRMTSETALVILKGDHWETGLTAELKDGGKSLVWRDGSVWKRR